MGKNRVHGQYVDADGWTVVARKNKRRQQVSVSNKNTDKLNRVRYTTRNPHECNEKLLIESVQHYVQKVAKTQYWQRVRKAITEALQTTVGPHWQEIGGKDDECRKIIRFACLGLGSFEKGMNHVARYQLAVALLIKQELYQQCEGQQHQQQQQVFVYDPCMTNQDHALVEKLGMSVGDNTGNNYGKCYTVCENEAAVLFFMPHCEKKLYSHIVRANWLKPLGRVIIFGNSFDSILEKSEVTWIRKTVDMGFCHEVVIECEDVGHHGKRWEDLEVPYGAFSSLSVHTFRPKE